MKRSKNKRREICNHQVVKSMAAWQKEKRRIKTKEIQKKKKKKKKKNNNKNKKINHRPW